jgi:Recombination endonuclease VII
MKRCPCCGESKPLEDFPRNRRTKDGLAAYCKPCHNAKGRASRERSGGARKYHLWLRYGLTLDDVDRLLTSQAGVCAICGARDPQHVDHDHDSGRVRGLLCFNCNGGLGQFKDNASNLRRAADYLDQAASAEQGLVAEPRRRRGEPRVPTLPFGDIAS